MLSSMISSLPPMFTLATTWLRSIHNTLSQYSSAGQLSTASVRRTCRNKNHKIVANQVDLNRLSFMILAQRRNDFIYAFADCNKTIKLVCVGTGNYNFGRHAS